MGKYTFGIVSDSHQGSHTARVDCLKQMYKIFKERGITTVLHAGDWMDGVRVYPGQEDNLSHPTWEKQAIEVMQNYPSVKGITTIGITGNHDLKQPSLDPMNLVVRGIDYEYGSGQKVYYPGRTDIKYIGKYKARVELPGGILVDLLHGAGGGGSNRAGPATKVVKGTHPRQLPHILILGHYHFAEHLRIGGVHVFMPGCFQDNSEFNVRRALPAELGGWIVEYEYDNGVITRIRPEFIQFENLPDYNKVAYTVKGRA